MKSEKTKDKLTFSQASDELQQIINEIEGGQISVDLLASKVKRAGELIRFCKQKLKNTEEDVNTILKQLED